MTRSIRLAEDHWPRQRMLYRWAILSSVDTYFYVGSARSHTCFQFGPKIQRYGSARAGGAADRRCLYIALTLCMAVSFFRLVAHCRLAGWMARRIARSKRSEIQEGWKILRSAGWAERDVSTFLCSVPFFSTAASFQALLLCVYAVGMCYDYAQIWYCSYTYFVYVCEVIDETSLRRRLRSEGPSSHRSKAQKTSNGAHRALSFALTCSHLGEKGFAVLPFLPSLWITTTDRDLLLEYYQRNCCLLRPVSAVEPVAFPSSHLSALRKRNSELVLERWK